MASIILGAVGAGIGALFGQPALGYAIGSTIGNIVSPKKGPKTKGPRINDLKIQSSEYARSIPIVFGSARLAGNVIWASDLIETAHSNDNGTTYTYAANFAVGICEGPIMGITKIWANTFLIYNKSVTSLPPGIRVYTGSETQTPDGLLQTYLGVGNVPAYRGLVYVVFDHFELQQYGNRIPSISVEASTSSATVATSIPLASILNTLCNKAGLPSAQIDVSLVTNPVDGYIVTDTVEVRNAIIPLASGFGFDIVESANKIKFVNRAGISVVNIPFEELVDM